MIPTVKCSRCAKDMEFEVRVPSLSVPGQVHDFFSCECGRVTSQAHNEGAPSQAPNENKKIVDDHFVAWATKKKNFPNGRWAQKIRAHAGAQAL